MAEQADFQSLSTSDVPAAIRLRRWNEFISETFATMRVEPSNPTDFSATLSRIKIGALGLSWYETTASAGLVDVGTVGPWSAPIGDAFILAIQETGTSIGHYFGREIVSEPGDMVLLDAGRPWRIESQGAISAVGLKIPADRLMRVLPDPEAACGLRFGIERPRVALASSLILRIKAAVAADPAADWSLYEDILFGIVATLRQLVSDDGAHVSRTGNQRRRACAFIERHLDDPELDVNAVAEALDTSIRSVQRIFGEIGYTPRSYIAERRVDVAAERLRRTDFRDTSITDIAFSLGFNDLSHFIRCFRKKWGTSPRDFRAAQTITLPS